MTHALLLLIATADAERFPFTLPKEARAAEWQVATETAGFALAPPSAGPGGELHTIGDEIELRVRDMDGHLHRVRLPSPHTPQEREALLILAANLIRPARFSAPPPLPPTSSHPVSRPPPRPDPPRPPPLVLPSLDGQSAAVSAPMPSHLLMDVPEPPLALARFQPPAPAPTVRHRLRFDGGVTGRAASSPGVSLGVTYRYGERLWLGGAGRFGYEKTHPSGLINAEMIDLGVLAGVGWQGDGTRALEFGLWTGPIWRVVNGFCYMCDMNTAEIQAAEVALEDGTQDTNLYWMGESTTNTIWTTQASLGIHLPLGASGWEVVPFLQAGVESSPVTVPGYYGRDEISVWQVTAGVGIERLFRPKKKL